MTTATKSLNVHRSIVTQIGVCFGVSFILILAAFLVPGEQQAAAPLATQTGTLQICSDAADTDVTGFFDFTVEGAAGSVFTVPAGFCSDPITITVPQTGTAPLTVKVTELARPNYRLIGVATTPADALASRFTRDAGFDANGAPLANNTNGGYAVVDLTAAGVGATTVIRFTNQSLPGRIKLCKITADPVNIPVGTLFTFTVSGLHPTSATQTLPGIQTTETVQVFAGPVSQNGYCAYAPGTWIVGTPVTVTETAAASLPNGLTFADVRVSKIMGLPSISSSNLAGKTATLNARNTTAEISFTSFIFRPAIVKICKNGNNGLMGNFSFTMSLPDPLTSYPVSTTPIVVPVGSCTFAPGPFSPTPQFPGIGTFNVGTQLTLTETQAGASVLVSVTSASGNAVTQELANRSGTITLSRNAIGNNFNEIDFMNSIEGPWPNRARFDFDGDGKSDVAVYRSGTWWYAASGSSMAATPIQFGIPGDKLVAADYDGDGRTDAAVYRNGTWFVNGSTSGFIVLQFGLATDIPQPGDFDGDGKADFVVFRPSDGNWYMQLSYGGFKAVHFGIETDKPVAADFDGDGRFDQAVYRDGTWYILASVDGFSALRFGSTGDIPLPADYDGDRKADIALNRSGIWYILGSATGFRSVGFGLSTDTPVPADYDGDGKTDIAVCRTSTMTWYVANVSPTQDWGFYIFGSPGDVLMNY